MSELRIRNVDPLFVDRLKKIARHNGRTLEKQVLAMLEEKFVFDKKAFFAELRKERERQSGAPSDSTLGIREERDAM